jgi:hypothetical protein
MDGDQHMGHPQESGLRDVAPSKVTLLSRALASARAPLSRTSWHRSWRLALITAVTLGLAAYLDNSTATQKLRMLWPPALMVLWLCVGTRLIDWAHSCAATFESQASRLLADSAPSTTVWAIQRSWLCRSSARVVQVLFAGAGLLCVLLVALPWHWTLGWAVTIGLTFYLGAIGLWGSWVVTKGVAAVATDALKAERLNVFHADRLAGLGFAVRYADVATLLLLTGVSSLPMASLIVDKSIAMNSTLGWILVGIVVLLVGTWAVFTLQATLSARSSVASALDAYRDPILNRLAAEKARLIATNATAEEFQRLEIQEKAAAELRSGLFSGAGGWKDMFSVMAAGACVVDMWDKVHKALPI